MAVRDPIDRVVCGPPSAEPVKNVCGWPAGLHDSLTCARLGCAHACPCADPGRRGRTAPCRDPAPLSRARRSRRHGRGRRPGRHRGGRRRAGRPRRPRSHAAGRRAARPCSTAIRDRGDTPVLIASAKRSDLERIAGLRMGADDYLAKPFNPHELTARVAAVLRRSRGAAAAATAVGPAGRGRDAAVLRWRPTGRRSGEPALHARTCRRRSGDERSLTPGEIGLLAALARRPGAVLTRDQLLEAVTRRPDEVYDRVIDVHVANLRRKLGDDARRSVAHRDDPADGLPARRRAGSRVTGMGAPAVVAPASASRRSLAWRLGLLLGVTVIAVLLLVGIVVNRVVSDSYETVLTDQQQQRLDDAAVTLADRLARPAGLARAQAYAMRLATSLGGEIRVIGTDGTTLAAFGRPAGRRPDALRDADRGRRRRHRPRSRPTSRPGPAIAASCRCSTSRSSSPGSSASSGSCSCPRRSRAG